MTHKSTKKKKKEKEGKLMCHIQWDSPWMDTWHMITERWRNLAHAMWSWPARAFIYLSRCKLIVLLTYLKRICGHEQLEAYSWWVNALWLSFVCPHILSPRMGTVFSEFKADHVTEGVSTALACIVCALSCRTADWLMGLYSFWDGHALTLKSSGMRSLDVLRKLRM